MQMYKKRRYALYKQYCSKREPWLEIKQLLRREYYEQVFADTFKNLSEITDFHQNVYYQTKEETEKLNDLITIPKHVGG